MRTPKKKSVAARKRGVTGAADTRVPIVITPAQRRRDRLQQTLTTVKTYVESLRPIPEPVPELEVPNFLEAIRQHRLSQINGAAFLPQEGSAAASVPQRSAAPQIPTLPLTDAPPRQRPIFQSKSKATQQSDPLRAAFQRPVPADPVDLRPKRPNPGIGQNRRFELAAVAMNTTLLLTAAPVGAALVTYSVLRKPHAGASFRAMALVGISTSLAPQLPLLAALVGVS